MLNQQGFVAFDFSKSTEVTSQERYLKETVSASEKVPLLPIRF